MERKNNGAEDLKVNIFSKTRIDRPVLGSDPLAFVPCAQTDLDRFLDMKDYVLTN